MLGDLRHGEPALRSDTIFRCLDLHLFLIGCMLRHRQEVGDQVETEQVSFALAFLDLRP